MGTMTRSQLRRQLLKAKRHLPDNLRPRNTSLPTIVGTAIQGVQLQATAGNWENNPLSYAFQWQADGINIAGANTELFTPTDVEVGKSLSVVVTASNTSGVSIAESVGTSPTLPALPFVITKATINGTVGEGNLLTLTAETWGNSPTSFLREWLRDHSTVVGTGSSYTVQAGDVGHVITCRITATNAAGNTVSETDPAQNPVATPVNTGLPVITSPEGGNPVVARVGNVLTSDTGIWTGTPTLFEYQWTLDGVDVGGQTTNQYIPVTTDIGKVARCRVKATNGSGNASATSAATATIVAIAPTNTSIPTITGNAVEGQTLTRATGVWTGSPTFATQWLRDDVAITGATASTYLLSNADIGHQISVQVTGTNSGGNISVKSVKTNIVTSSTGTPIVGTVVPSWITSTASATSKGLINSNIVDQTTAFNNAVNSLQNNQALIIPANWVIKHNNDLRVSNKNNWAIVGGGRDTCKLVATNIIDNMVFELVNCDNVYIGGIAHRNDTIDPVNGEGPSAPTKNLWHLNNCSNVTLEGLRTYRPRNVSYFVGSGSNINILSCESVESFRDSFHITYKSSNVLLQYCVAIGSGTPHNSGSYGDDAFASIGIKAIAPDTLGAFNTNIRFLDCKSYGFPKVGSIHFEGTQGGEASRCEVTDTGNPGITLSSQTQWKTGAVNDILLEDNLLTRNSYRNQTPWIGGVFVHTNHGDIGFTDNSHINFIRTTIINPVNGPGVRLQSFTSGKKIRSTFTNTKMYQLSTPYVTVQQTGGDVSTTRTGTTLDDQAVTGG